MMETLAQLGLQAGAAGWRIGHAAVRSGALAPLDVPEDERDELLRRAAAGEARDYMDAMVARHGLTPAQGVRLFAVYVYAFVRGALDQALDGGALLHTVEP